MLATALAENTPVLSSDEGFSAMRDVGIERNERELTSFWKPSKLPVVQYKGGQMAESSTDVIKRYLADAIAAEKNFETQVHGFSKQGEDEAVKAVFRQQALETKRQCERLVARLHSVGGSPSATKDLLGHIFGLSLRSIQLGHEKEERATQNLTIAYAFQNSKIAMYESLATMADAAGDSETAQIARDIQAEQNAMAKTIWDLLTPAGASASRRAASGPEPGHPAPIT